LDTNSKGLGLAKNDKRRILEKVSRGKSAMVSSATTGKGFYMVEQRILDALDYCPIHPYEQLTIGAMGKLCPQCWDEMYPMKAAPGIDPWYVELNADDIELAKTIANQRQALHKKAMNQTIRFFHDESTEDQRGFLGEIAFGKLFGIKPTTDDLVYGDGGTDFRINGYSINVKVARKPLFLFKKINEKCADIFVLGHLHEPKNAVTFLGWEYGNVMKTMPTRDFGYGIENHYKPQALLKTMFSLELKLGYCREKDDLR
jgi:hypothetical protein